ncbi:MAG: Uma2 family endonuclease [Isosphaeraceae bacterium]|jgi:Uma2 family endonuclease
MATVVSDTRLVQGENRVVIRGVGWEGYQTLLSLVGNQKVRLTYDRGDVELMSPLSRHERNKSRLGRMVEILTEELDIPVICMGSTTLNREDLDRGLEADDSFYLKSYSLIGNVDHLDMNVDPPPDLAIEIEISRSVLNRLGIYGALGVPEIWRFDGKKLRVLLRQEDGAYRENAESVALPWISIEELLQFVVEDDYREDTQWAKAFRRWVRETIVPRARGGSEND